MAIIQVNKDVRRVTCPKCGSDDIHTTLTGVSFFFKTKYTVETECNSCGANVTTAFKDFPLESEV